MAVMATLETRRVPAEAGGEGACTVRVRNTAALVAEVTLSVVGSPSAYAEVAPPVLRLFPGESGEAIVRFRPPRDPMTRAGEIPFGVRVTTSADAGAATVEEGSLAVAPFHDIRARLTPTRSTGRRRGRHRVRVHNVGNSPEQIAVSASDPDDAIGFRLTPPRLALEPGERGEVRLIARSRQASWAGAAQPHPFQVTVAAPGAQPVALDAALVQRPILARWMLVVGALLACGLVAVLIISALHSGPTSTALAGADHTGTATAGPSPGATPSPGTTPGTTPVATPTTTPATTTATSSTTTSSVPVHLIGSPIARATPAPTPTPVPTATPLPSSPTFPPCTAGGVSGADLQINMAPTGQNKPGGIVTYQVHICNLGPATEPAGSATVTDTFPRGMTPIQFAGNWQCSANGQTVTCSSASDLPAGSSSDLAMFVSIDGSAPHGATFDDTAAVQGTVADPDPSNNAVQARITLQ
jgi:uncharacterized repeat protein (TIGR01451 family)